MPKIIDRSHCGGAQSRAARDNGAELKVTKHTCSLERSMLMLRVLNKKRNQPIKVILRQSRFTDSHLPMAPENP